jgi:hypothetical protein
VARRSRPGDPGANPRILLVARVDVALLIAIVFVMAAKPFL